MNLICGPVREKLSSSEADVANGSSSAVLTFYAFNRNFDFDRIKEKRGKGNFIREECSRKLPQFLKKDSITYLGLQPFINKDLSEKDIFDKLTHIRHKVIHGILKEAREILREFISYAEGGIWWSY